MRKLTEIIESMDFDFWGSGLYKSTSGDFLKDSEAVFLDIRTQEEIETVSLDLKHFLEVVKIPLHELPARLNEIPKNRKVGLFCSSGTRIAIAYAYLRAAGFDNVVMIIGGFSAIAGELKPGKILKAIELNK